MARHVDCGEWSSGLLSADAATRKFRIVEGRPSLLCDYWWLGMCMHRWISSLLLMLLLIQSAVPCCLCYQASGVSSETTTSSFDCSCCPSSNQQSAPSDHESRHSPCHLCRGVVLETSPIVALAWGEFTQSSNWSETAIVASRSGGRLAIKPSRFEPCRFVDIGTRLLV